MAYNFQYQAKTEPVLIIAAAITVAMWAQPWSEPVRDQAFEVVSDVSTFVVPVAPPVSIGWYLPLVDPVKEQPFKVSSSVRTFSVPFYPFPDKWFTPLSEPVRPKLGRQQQDLAYGYLAPSSQVIPIDWAQELYQPRLESFDVVSDISTFVVPTTAAPTDTKWIYPWSEPVRQKPGLGVQHQQAAWLVKADPFPETVTEDRWHQPWSTPTLRKPSTTQQVLAYVNAPTETITEDKWHQPWSIPTVRKSNAVYQQSFASGLGELTLEAKHHQPWSEPVRRKPSVAYQQPLAYVAVVATPETITEDKWHQPWSEPTRRKPSTSQQDLAYGYFAPAPPVTVTPIDWAQELYQPRPEGFDVVSDTSVFVVPTTPVVDPGDIKWQSRWPDRLDTKPRPTSHQSSVAPLLPPAITPIDWAQELYQPRLENYEVVSTTAVFTAIASVAPAAPTDIKWQSCWPDRLYTKTLPVSAYQVTTHIPVKTFYPFGVVSQGPIFTQVTQYQSRSSLVPIVAPPPPVVPIDWSQELYQPLPQSYDVVSDTSVFVAIANPPTPPTTDIKWQSRWPDRLYTKSLPVSAYQVSTHIPVKTFYPFSVTGQGPVFTQITPYQSVARPPSIIIPEVITEDKWHQPWSIPNRLSKLGLLSSAQQPVSVTIVPPVIRYWIYPWTDPVRDQAYEVVSDIRSFVVPPPEVITQDKWHYAWSQPVRLKPGLKAGLQQTLTWYPRIIVNPVFVTMNAYETNRDIFEGAIVTYKNDATRCLVSIKEIRIPSQSLSSIEEPEM